MKDEEKTKEELILEMERLRARNAELEALKARKTGAGTPTDRGEFGGGLLDGAGSVALPEDQPNGADRELVKFRALYELALAMTAEGRLDENLALIVKTAANLLYADKAFLALRDEQTNELFMHTLYGIVTERFKKLRIPWGVGLGGSVAQSGRLRVVEDYYAEIGPDFHDVVRGEGLLSGIAAPVQHGGENVGVLYVFNRTRKPFSQLDLDTLSLLGNLAAVEITRRRAFEELQESRTRIAGLYEDSRRREELYRSLLQSSADAIVSYDLEGRVQYINPSFTNIFGWTMEELEGRRIPFVPDSEIEVSLFKIRKMIADGEPLSGFETRRFTKDGRLLDISISASRFHDHDGAPAGLLTILRDVTHGKRAERALRESEERYRKLYAESESRRRRYRTLLDASPDPIVVYDMKGVPSYTNPAFTELFGWSFEDPPQNSSDFVPEENWPETQEMIRKVIKGEGFSGAETRRYTKDGRVIDVSISGAAFFDQDDKPTGSVVHLRDITSRKAMEADLAAELKKFRALYDLAMAMTGDRDLEENLRLVVEKSRELLVADKSCLALRDENAGDLYMHTMSGIVTDGFKALRIPIGVGLGGKVAETGRVIVVEDYFQETGPAFHDVAKAEGLLSGIAVPVQLGGANLGVLYVFNRVKRPFSKSDLDTLSLLGNLAAVEITRKRSQERLKESEESFKLLYQEAKRREELYVSLLNSSADAIAIYDMEGMARYVSPSFTQIFGWTMEEVEGKRIPFVPDDQREPTMEIIRSLTVEGKPCHGFETKRFTKDGWLLDISISSSRYRDHDGEPAGILVVLRDITDRKRAEAALRASEERFRTLAELAPLGLVIMGADNRTDYINPKFTELFGYDIDDLPDTEAWFRKAYHTEESRTRAEAIWWEDRQDVRARYGFGVEAKPRSFKLRCKDGAAKIVSFRAMAPADGRIISTFLDVTSEVEAQQEILRAKTEWERTFNAVSDLILILDEDMKVVRANNALVDRLGTPLEKLIGMSCRPGGAAEDATSILCPDESLFSEGRETSAQLTDERLGGIFDLRASPLRDESGKLLGSVLVARDITAFKSLERARRSAVHHLSHELNTPLAIIKGSVKRLAEEGMSLEARERRVERIKRSLGRLSEIQRIVSEIVAPKSRFPREFPIVDTLEELLDQIRRQSSNRRVDIVAELEPIHTDEIDPGVFEDVVNTLVKNAVENTPDRGRVLVRLQDSPEGVLFQVKDSGIGIDWGHRQFLFDAFHHTQETDSYATRNPYEFGAGGKGLELMRLKILSEEGSFRISFESQRCRHMTAHKQDCPGSVDECPYVSDLAECEAAGGTTFSVLFPKRGSS